MYDIVFISYNEPNAEENYAKLIARFPKAKRVDGIKGIHYAHIAAAKKCLTRMFWVVDGDAEIVDSFDFNYNVRDETDTVHVWRSINPINGLEYGYGGVKLLPRLLTLRMDTDSIDMTMSISDKFKTHDTISNITRFNTDPFNSWKSAFRECCKLATIGDAEALIRLDRWCIVGRDLDAIAGANAGKTYGQENASNKEALAKINDFTWLQDRWSLEKSQQ
jgi:hypothetical protein